MGIKRMFGQEIAFRYAKVPTTRQLTQIINECKYLIYLYVFVTSYHFAEQRTVYGHLKYRGRGNLASTKTVTNEQQLQQEVG